MSWTTEEVYFNNSFLRGRSIQEIGLFVFPIYWLYFKIILGNLVPNVVNDICVKYTKDI